MKKTAKKRASFVERLISTSKKAGTSSVTLLPNGRIVPRCTVCDVEVGAGGRKTAPAKCARCYQRERRRQPEAPRSTAEPRDQSITIQITDSTRQRLEGIANTHGTTVSTLVARFVSVGLHDVEAGRLEFHHKGRRAPPGWVF